MPIQRAARVLGWRLLAAGAPLVCTAALALPPQHVPDVSGEHARSSPAWVRDGVIYEIFPRDFSPGGNFAGITAQLDRLKQLGVNILWLMPIHPLGELHKKGSIGSPYAVRDYYAINVDYGTADDLRALVRAAHLRGMKVIIDIVANHTSWDSVMMHEPDFYRHDASGKIIPPQPDWEDVAQLNYDNPALRAYMIDMLARWIRDFDLDGFRCDAAAYVPTSFWEAARTALAKIKPDIVMLAEADQADLLVRAFDVDYAWKLYHALAAAVQGQGPASAIVAAWRDAARTYPHGALHMAFTDNHDQLRALALFGERAALAAAALTFTLDGVPMLYNGMEAGDTAESAAPALCERLPIYWPSGELRPASPATFAALIALRKAHPALTRGNLLWLSNSDEQRVLTFLRRSDSETLLVAINLSSQPFAGRVEGLTGTFADVTPAIRDAKPADPAGAPPSLRLGAWEYRVFRRGPQIRQ